MIGVEGVSDTAVYRRIRRQLTKRHLLNVYSFGLCSRAQNNHKINPPYHRQQQNPKPPIQKSDVSSRSEANDNKADTDPPNPEQ